MGLQPLVTIVPALRAEGPQNGKKERILVLKNPTKGVGHLNPQNPPNARFENSLGLNPRPNTTAISTASM